MQSNATKSKSMQKLWDTTVHPLEWL
jgi:hypothetical protein